MRIMILVDIGVLARGKGHTIQLFQYSDTPGYIEMLYNGSHSSLRYEKAEKPELG